MTTFSRLPNQDTEPTGSAADQVVGRRVVLKGLTGLGLSAATLTVIAGCGNGGDGEADQADLSGITAAATEAVSGGQVPVGQAAFLEDQGIIVTQPTEGNYYVFSNRCTHQGGVVNRVSDQGTLVCPLHSAQFDMTTGEVVGGPAPQPLQKFDVPLS